MNEILKKRIDEAAINGSKHYDSDVSKYSQGKQVGYIRGFNEGAKYALQSQWISVKEALPPYDEEVLVIDKGHLNFEWGDAVCYFNHRSDDEEVKTYKNGFCDLYGEAGEVVYWLPIPQINRK